MKRYQRILICVAHPDRDQHILAYAAMISRLAGTAEIHLLHVESTEPLPYPADMLVPTEPPATSVQTLEQLANEHFKGHGGERIICEVLKGSPLLEVLRYGMEKEVDLIVVGRQARDGANEEHHASLARRVTSEATCSVLVVPANASSKVTKVLVPARDSECSANALEVACRFAGAMDAKVCCLNVFRVGGAYLEVGTTLEEHTALMRGWADRECERLLARLDTGGAALTCKCVPDLYARPVPIILAEIDNEAADLVVIGARGRTGAAGVLLGAVTEQLIRQSHVPLLAVKKKGECIGILQALLTLAG